YVARLRPDLRFSDGSPLTTADVRDTFEGIVDPDLGSVYARAYRRIARIEVRSETEVRFHLEAP
ncbi:MAG: ABC transporter substrate-binding protein, partial [Actinobacteria bacterium]|nr:ABC transporter substrate-binding protein [Actinomycetota bacterium]NIV56299.1 ABC transporter substrate-binding protein [Actinomycetota bacterium]NIV87800.1 ABC transporter substrate-binding protein [Actinomycetota bacterium]